MHTSVPNSGPDADFLNAAGSGSAGAEEELGPAKGHGRAGEALQVRDECVDLRRAERSLPALAEGRMPWGAVGVEARVDRLLGDEPFLARVLDGEVDVDEPGGREGCG